MDITATDKYVKFGSKRIPKGTASYTPYVGGYVLMHLSITGESPFSVRIEGNTINGAPITELSELTDFLDANLFKAGGGDGTVGVADITGLNPGNLIFGGVGGNEQRKIQGNDFNLIGGTYRVPYAVNGTEWQSGGLPVSSSGTSGTLSIRVVGTGTLRASDAIADTDLITLSQFKGIVNSTLTDSETSATLQALYSTAVVGTVVTATTALTEYRKISPTQWTKKTITIV